MQSLDNRNPPVQSQPAESPPKKRSFQIVKLEERIAPLRAGNDMHN
jgi:hypothetical protein